MNLKAAVVLAVGIMLAGAFSKGIYSIVSTGPGSSTVYKINHWTGKVTHCIIECAD